MIHRTFRGSFMAVLMVTALVASACTSTPESSGVDLRVPEGEAPEDGWPLILVAGDTDEELSPESDEIGSPAVVLQVSADSDAGEVSEAVFDARAENSISDTQVYAIAMSDDADSIVGAIDEHYPAMFAGIGLTSGEVSDANAVGLRTHVATQDRDVTDVADELMQGQRADVFDAAILKAEIIASTNPDDAALATDGDTETVFAATEPTTLTIDLDRPTVVHRWSLTFGSDSPSHVTLETSEDGEQWQEIDVADVEGNRLDRYVSPSQATAVRVTVDKGEVADLNVFGQLSDESLFTYEEYVGENVSLPYRLYVPESSEGPLPVVLFLHGSGERGTDAAQHLGATKGEGAVRWASESEEGGNQAIVVAPQIPQDKLWRDPDVMEGLAELMDEIVAARGGDADRVYGTGLSIGAEGLLNVSILYPDLFAALIPVAGGPNNPVGGGPTVIDTVVPYVEQYAHIPMWELQAYDDDIRPFEKTLAMINALRGEGASPRLTVYLPDVISDVASSTHSSWLLAYDDPRLGDWMFAQNRADRPALGEPVDPIDPDMTGEELEELADPDSLYYEFE
ncbi:MAG: discoidin domain-containing protein [Ancrocorticia sp.]|uniref:discoidin domain-containing protein n=1 Tax=Ancrocorticia sp. TaxID=2593684 RepID=UPI003F925FF6